MIRSYVHLFLISLLFNSCIEQIELTTSGAGDNLVIFGNINTSDSDQVIEIYRLTDIQNRFLPISGATVLVVDDQGNQGRMFGDSEGIYTLSPTSIEIVPGKVYHLDITLISGVRYQTKPQQVPTVTITEHINRRYRKAKELSDDGIETEKILFEVLGTTCIDNPNNENFYIRWQTVEDYLFFITDFPDPLSFSDTPPPFYCGTILNEQRILTFNSEGAKVDSIGSKLVAFTDFDDSFRLKHFTTTYVHSMTREAYDFWNRLNILTNSTGSIFDIPPGKIRSNIFNVEDESEEVLGFVEFTNTTWSRFVTFIDDGPYLPPYPCEWTPFKEVDDYPCHCISCLERDNCTTVRPTMFDE